MLDTTLNEDAPLRAREEGPHRDDLALALKQIRAQTDALQRQFPEWLAAYDDLLPDSVATREEMAAVMLAAPTPFALGLMWGKFTLRQEISSVTSIPFD